MNNIEEKLRQEYQDNIIDDECLCEECGIDISPKEYNENKGLCFHCLWELSN